MTKFNGFRKDFFSFFEALKNNNNREWFADNKPRYYESVVKPMGEFIVAIAPHLQRISPYYIANPKPHGGSMFRIYRDTRFSKDKTPIKPMLPAISGTKQDATPMPPGSMLTLKRTASILAAESGFHPLNNWA